MLLVHAQTKQARHKVVQTFCRIIRAFSYLSRNQSHFRGVKCENRHQMVEVGPPLFRTHASRKLIQFLGGEGAANALSDLLSGQGHCGLARPLWRPQELFLLMSAG